MTAAVVYTFERSLYLTRDGMVIFPDHRRKPTCIADVPWLPVRIMPLESTGEMIAFIAEGLRESIPINEGIQSNPLDERLTKILLKFTGSRSDSAFLKSTHGLTVSRDKSGGYFLNFFPAHEKDPAKGWYRVPLENDAASLPSQVIRYLYELHEEKIAFSAMTKIQ